MRIRNLIAPALAFAMILVVSNPANASPPSNINPTIVASIDTSPPVIGALTIDKIMNAEVAFAVDLPISEEVQTDVAMAVSGVYLDTSTLSVAANAAPNNLPSANAREVTFNEPCIVPRL